MIFPSTLLVSTNSTERLLDNCTGVVWTVNDGVTTNAKLANMATARIKGRTSAGDGAPEDLTATQATALLNAMVGDAGTGGTKGLVPAPAAGDATKVLTGAGVWAALPSQIPPGMTATFAMSSPPAGWLAEDGSAVSATTYVALDAAIYCGNANNATAAWGYRCTNPANPGGSRSTTGTHIVLRDRRGEFERGWDNGRGVDSGRSLWATQAATRVPNFNVDSSGALLAAKQTLVADSEGSSGSATRTVFSGGADNSTITQYFAVRPRNVAGLSCIKY